MSSRYNNDDDDDATLSLRIVASSQSCCHRRTDIGYVTVAVYMLATTLSPCEATYTLPLSRRVQSCSHCHLETVCIVLVTVYTVICRGDTLFRYVHSRSHNLYTRTCTLVYTPSTCAHTVILQYCHCVHCHSNCRTETTCTVTVAVCELKLSPSHCGTAYSRGLVIAVSRCMRSSHWHRVRCQFRLRSIIVNTKTSLYYRGTHIHNVNVYAGAATLLPRSHP